MAPCSVPCSTTTGRPADALERLRRGARGSEWLEAFDTRAEALAYVERTRAEMDRQPAWYGHAEQRFTVEHGPAPEPLIEHPQIGHLEPCEPCCGPATAGWGGHG